MTRVKLKTGEPHQEKLDLLAVLLHEGERTPAWLDEASGGAARRATKLGDFDGSLRQTTLLYGSGKAARLLLVGAGPRKGARAESLRRAVGAAVRAAQDVEARTLGIVHPARPPRGLDAAAVAAACGEAAVLAGYRFDRHKQATASEVRRLAVSVFAPASTRSALWSAVTVAEAVNLARDLANEPGNYGTPAALAAAATKAGKAAGFKVKVLKKPDMVKLKMGGLLGVARGSATPPRFIQMEYSPRGRVKAAGTVCLVGKGLTFDSGGISLKPAEKMWEMKFDKCGGCAVIGAMTAIARTALPVRVVGLVPSTENMPGADANKPGDVLVACNGKTIEVLNTDAEGRLILADALAYSARFEPDVVVDFATLTGSVVVALGDVRAGLMSPDDALARAVERAGEVSGEQVWRLPLDDAYGEHVKSDVADVKNLGKARQAGSIAGGWFLRHFVPEGPAWAHLDIAGTAWNSSDPKNGYIASGATGFGVRLAWELVRARCDR